MNYRDTLNLPKTEFPMRANLPQREPEMLKLWKERGLYSRIIEKSKISGDKYILHDGPPYANGDIHMGHALNKILKDIVVKYKTMAGWHVPFVPGWDCHGLPVEHQLMKDLKIKKGDIPQSAFRRKARDFALKYVETQKMQFERLGVFGDWERPYLTLDPGYEAAITRSLARLVGAGYVYKDLKPVNWCYGCETALAEAEVEYEMHTSPSVFVKFKLAGAKKLKNIFDEPRAGEAGEDTYILIWTTTPWTLVANVAVALSPSMKYVLVKHKGSHIILAEDLLGPVSQKCGLKDTDVIASAQGKNLEGMDCMHPFIDRKSKIVTADYVSREEGTGCVHTAPGHGQEDHITGKRYNLPTFMPVDPKGRFDETAGDLQGVHVLDANEKIIKKLKENGALLCSDEIRHSYPHCWRCKKPIIFRATAQYFINVDHGGLREKVRRAIEDKVAWIPKTGKDRISVMVQNRPDWCLSRQRLWGVPIAAFYCLRCDELLLNEKVIGHVAGIFEKEGSDAWFEKDASELLPGGTRCSRCKGDTFRKESDILDVWFESGVSHQAVLKPRGEFPADLYLEGSDQHRGWFQSAIISSMAIDGKVPYRSVLTHGFVVDGEGKKMSKSLGNVISPEDVMQKYGADILRIWVASCDYGDDVRLSNEILARLAEAYRKIRNTCRYILGNLGDFDPAADKVAVKNWAEIDRWALWRAYVLLESAGNDFEGFTFHKAFNSIYNFCVVDMSSIYLDVLKDLLYTCGKNSVERRSAQSALFEIVSILTKVMAPILSYTAEEVWMNLSPGGKNTSIHLEEWPDAKELEKRISRNFRKADMAKWDSYLLPLRSAVLKKLEEIRTAGVIGSSLDAKVTLNSSDGKWSGELRKSRDILNKLLIVSHIEITRDLPEGSTPAGDIPVNIKAVKAEGEKCQRCWNYSREVGSFAAHPGLCARCADVIEKLVSKGKTNE